MVTGIIKLLPIAESDINRIVIGKLIGIDNFVEMYPVSDAAGDCFLIMDMFGMNPARYNLDKTREIVSELYPGLPVDYVEISHNPHIMSKKEAMSIIMGKEIEIPDDETLRQRELENRLHSRTEGQFLKRFACPDCKQAYGNYMKSNLSFEDIVKKCIDAAFDADTGEWNRYYNLLNSENGKNIIINKHDDKDDVLNRGDNTHIVIARYYAAIANSGNNVKIEVDKAYASTILNIGNDVDITINNDEDLDLKSTGRNVNIKYSGTCANIENIGQNCSIEISFGKWSIRRISVRGESGSTLNIEGKRYIFGQDLKPLTWYLITNKDEIEERKGDMPPWKWDMTTNT